MPKGCGPREPHDGRLERSSLYCSTSLQKSAPARACLASSRACVHPRVELRLRRGGRDPEREDAYVDGLLVADLLDPVLVRGQRVLIGDVHARTHAKLDELPLEDLPPDLVAEVLLGEAAPPDFVEHVGGRDGAALRRLRLRGDVGDAAVDLLGRHADARLVGLLLLETIVDHPIEELLVHLLLLHADYVGVARLRADLDAPGHRAVEQLGPEDRPLADDGDDTLDDRRMRDGGLTQHRSQRDHKGDLGEPHAPSLSTPHSTHGSRLGTVLSGSQTFSACCTGSACVRPADRTSCVPSCARRA